MPVERRGILLNHFEKIICGVVGLLLLLSLFYAYKRTRGGQLEKVSERLDRSMARIETKLDGKPPAPPESKYLDQMAKGVRVGEAKEVGEIFWYPWPKYYEEVAIGKEQTHVLTFEEPLAVQSVTVEKESPNDDVIRSIEHPFGMDYRKVRIVTGDEEGSARIRGLIGERPHIWPVRVEKGWRPPPALAKGSLKLEAKRGRILVSFDPPDEGTGVDILGYQIFRKKARNLTGKFKLLPLKEEGPQEGVTEMGRLTKKVGEPSTRKPEGESRDRKEGSRRDRREGGPGAEGMPRGGDVRFARESEEERETAGEEEEPSEPAKVEYLDAQQIEPGEIYIYMVRVVAERSTPPVSEFTAEIWSDEVLPTVDFRLTNDKPSTRAGLRACVFEVFSDTEEGSEKSEDIVYVGESIGRGDFESGSELLDYHRKAMAVKPPPYRAGRVIVVDRWGIPRSQWIGMWQSGGRDKTPWDVEEQKSETRREYRGGEGRDFVNPDRR
ncbi:MAG: hypothetical protein ACLFWL_11985 [Candidatus Brocadiia bacterium]